jgi:hypothetical protein
MKVSLKSDKHNGYCTKIIFYHISFKSPYNEKDPHTILEKTITNVMFNDVYFFRKLRRLRDNVEKCCRTRQVIDDNIITRMGITRWVAPATNTGSGYALVTAFPR